MASLILLSATSRLVLWRVGEKILDMPNGQRIFRGILIFALSSAGWAWSYSYYHALTTVGHSFESFLILATCSVIALVSAASFSFDLFATFTSQMLFMVPVGFGLLMRPDLPGARPLGMGSFFYLAYVMMHALSVRRTQIQTLKNYEELQAKDQALENAHSELDSQHRLVSTMLESIDEAFLVLDEDGVCRNQPSKRAKDMFGLDPRGLHLAEVTHLENETAKTMSWYKSMFMLEAVRASNLSEDPTQLDLKIDERMLKLKFHPMRNEKGELLNLVMTASDVTREVEAEREANEERDRAKMILRIQDHRSGFRPLLIEFETLIEAMKGFSLDKISEIKRTLHTLKGASALYGVPYLSKLVHGIELKIKNVHDNDLATVVREQAVFFSNEFYGWQNRELNLLTQLGVFEGEIIEVSRRKLEAIKGTYAGDQKIAWLCEKIISELSQVEFGDLFREFEFQIEHVATKLGKLVDFDVQPALSTPLYVIPQTLREPVRALLHLFNNSVDHGIEAPDQRRAMGKIDRGRISVRYKRVVESGKDYVQILIEDDGGGINLLKVREALKKRGRGLELAKADLEVAMHVFDEGLSTRDSVIEVSGLGVGMGSVRSSILRARGKIRILRTNSAGTLFEVLLPLSEGA
jgi:two-component system chemotaxis sensor kinase CheA